MTLDEMLELKPEDYCLGQLQEVIEELTDVHYAASNDKDIRHKLAKQYERITTYYNRTAQFRCYYTDIRRSHVQEVKPIPVKVQRPQHQRKPSDLSVEEVETIKTLLATDVKRVEIANRFHVHPATISDIASGRFKQRKP